MSQERYLRVGPITGLSSYQLAIRLGLFTGTEAEYIQKEQLYYDEMVKYANQLKLDVADIISKVGDSSSGSWFIENNITDLNIVDKSVKSTMGSEVTSGKPEKINPDSFLTFESTVFKDVDGNPVYIRQVVCELTPDNEVLLYQRAQILENGVLTEDGWTEWSPFGNAIPDGVVCIGADIDTGSEYPATFNADQLQGHNAAYFDDKIDQNATNIARVEDVTSAIDEKVNAANESIGGLSTKLTEVKTTVESHTASIDQLNTKIGSSATDLTSAINQVSSKVDSSTTNLNSSISDLSGRLTAATTSHQTDINQVNTRIGNVETNVSDTRNNYLPKSGGSMTGALHASDDGNMSSRIRNVTISTSDITAGTTPLAPGSIYLVYEE